MFRITEEIEYCLLLRDERTAAGFLPLFSRPQTSVDTKLFRISMALNCYTVKTTCPYKARSTRIPIKPSSHLTGALLRPLTTSTFYVTHRNSTLNIWRVWFVWRKAANRGGGRLTYKYYVWYN